jgi:putative tryptophan/tyrosine transport system substrate-binding protein
LELLKEALPHATRIAVCWSPVTPSHSTVLKAVEAAGQAARIAVHVAPAQTIEDFDKAFAAMTRQRADGVLVLTAPPFFFQRTALADLALNNRLPGMFGSKEYVEVGGLIAMVANCDAEPELATIDAGLGFVVESRREQTFFRSTLKLGEGACDWKPLEHLPTSGVEKG